jgi:hypothetical protein
VAHRKSRSQLRLTTTVVLIALLAGAITSLSAASVCAQSSELRQPASLGAPRVGVLLMREHDEQRDEFQQRVERVLMHGLLELGFSVNPSALPFVEAQLAAGCTGELRACGRQVAEALESEQLIVTVFERGSAAGRASLSLYRFDTRSRTYVGTAQLEQGDAAELSASVTALLQSVFADVHPGQPAGLRAHDISAAPAANAGPREQAALAQPGQQDVDALRQKRAWRAVGYSGLVLGVGLLAGGIATNRAAHRAADRYAELPTGSASEVDAKLAHYDTANSKAETGRILLGTGGALAAVGIFALLWQRFALSPDRKLQPSAMAANGSGAMPRILAAPLPRGFAFAWRAEL